MESAPAPGDSQTGVPWESLSRLVRARNEKEIGRLLEEPYDQPTSTNIPTGPGEVAQPVGKVNP